MMPKRISAGIGALVLALGAQCGATHFRWASQAESNTLDPHAVSEPVTNAINWMVYDRLVLRDKSLSPIPGLATSWRNTSPTTWVFELRRGVRFHDGTPLTADDVVFSFERAREYGSTFRVYAEKAGRVRALGEHAVEFTTPSPNPVMDETVANIGIMSRRWCERHRVTRPQRYDRGEETYAVRNAMGTGPFILVSREPGVRTIHRRNPDWWGTREGLYEGNLDTIEYIPLASPSTRTAALLAGQVDFVLDPPVQDLARLRAEPSVRIWEGPENRVVYLGFDQRRDELLYSSVKGRNPFKDRRVRRAIQLAIDRDALQKQVMRGMSAPTLVAFHNPQGAGLQPDFPGRAGFDPGAARRLLAEAGYPDGFSFRLNCTTDRFVNDEQLCVAVGAMLSRVGLEVTAQPEPRAVFGAKAFRRELTAYLMSYGGADWDPVFMLKAAMHGPAADGAGQMNYGEGRIPEVDALIDALEVEMDSGRRKLLAQRALEVIRDEAHVVPLHRQVTAWASRAQVWTIHTPNNVVNPLWVQVKLK